jgi:hypothetical protein
VNDEDLHADAGWTKIAAADDFLPVDGEFVNINFDAVKAKAVKFRVLAGVGGWASAAEIQFGFTDVWYQPLEGFTPKSPVPPVGTVPVVETEEIVVETEPEPIAPETEAPAAEVVAPVVAPQTGDGMAVVVALLIISAASIVIIKKKATR